MLKAEIDELVKSIFSDKVMFEKHILDVTCNSDRIDVMDILAKRLVRILLKEELNFLYMKDLTNFKFSLIVNLLFREIANEWVSYAVDSLAYSQEDALEVIQHKSNVMLLLRLVKEYFKQYKIYFVQEIADTFIELVENMPSPSTSNDLIDEVLKSGFVKSQGISVVYSYSQLWGRVKNAHKIKKNDITKLQIKLSEAQDIEKRKQYEYDEEVLALQPLAFFDDAILRLRNAMVKYMMGIESFKYL